MVGGSYRVTGAGGLMTSLPPQAAHWSLSHPFSVSVSVHRPFLDFTNALLELSSETCLLRRKTPKPSTVRMFQLVFQHLLHAIESITQIAIERFCMFGQPFLGKNVKYFFFKFLFLPEE